MIYLDNASTTIVKQEIIEEMRPYFQEKFFNSESVYCGKEGIKTAIDKARKQVADMLHVEPEQIIFTSGGTEGNNMILNNALASHYNIITDKGEHDSILNRLETCDNVYYTGSSVIGIGGNRIEEVLDKIPSVDRKQILVSIMHTSNETGIVNNIKSISEICKTNNMKFHSDCVQALGFADLNLQKLGVDYATISGHKIHAPKGIGAVYIKDPTEFKPLICGGTQQEFGLRGGTLNVPYIVAFGKACEISKNNLEKCQSSVRKLKNNFIQNMIYLLNGYKILNLWHINANGDSKVLNIRFDGIDAQTLVLLCAEHGVIFSAGSACRSHESNASPALLDIGLSENEARNSIRISFSGYEEVNQITKATSIIAEQVNKLYFDRYN